MNIPPLSDNFVYQGLDSLNFDNFSTAMFFITLCTFSIACVFLIQTFSIGLFKKQNKTIKEKLIITVNSITMLWIFTQIICAIFWIRSYNQMPVKTLSILLIITLPFCINQIYTKITIFFSKKEYENLKAHHEKIYKLNESINKSIMTLDEIIQEHVNNKKMLEEKIIQLDQDIKNKTDKLEKIKSEIEQKEKEINSKMKIDNSVTSEKQGLV